MNNSSNNTNDLLFCPYSDIQTPKRSHEHSSFTPSASSFNDILLNPNPKLSDHHLLLDSSPSPRFEFDPESLYAVFLQPNNDHHDDNDMIRQPSLALPTVEDQQSFDASETITHMEDSKKTPNSRDPSQGSKRKTSKTDRHSKIYTAKGPRDRRMRLSLEVARDFFGLQDMLGFDKASKTVEWLLKQAKPEIKKLARSLPHRFNNGLSSEESQTRRGDLGEVASGWVDERGNKINTEIKNAISTDLWEVASTSTDKRGDHEIDRKKSGKEKKKRSQSRNPAVLRKLPRDARAKARERAKERTKEKMMMRQRSISSEAVMIKINMSDVTDQLEDSVQEMEEVPSTSNRPFVGCDNNNMGMNQEDGIAQESLDIINKWSPFSIFNYHHHNHGSAASMEHQFTDLHHLSGKPRNAFYNSHNMS